MHRALTGREREMMILVIRGDENQEIARKLAISIETVKTALSRIYGVLGTSSRVSAAYIILGEDKEVSSSIRFDTRTQEDLLRPLTPREKEIMGYVTKGCGNKEIGRVLGISPYTVRETVKRALNVLGARNRTHGAATMRKIEMSAATA